MNYRHSTAAQAGLTLIELMVALLIGTLLVLGLVQVFGASRAAYQMSEGMSRVQENARFALDILQRDVRMAGHMGCVNDQAHFVRDDGDPLPHFAGVAEGSRHALDFRVGIQGYEAPGTGPGETLELGGAWQAPANLTAALTALDPVPGSDVLVLRYLANEGVPVSTIAAAPGGGELLTWPSGRASALQAGGVADPVMFGVADCSHVDIFPGAFSAAGSVVTNSGTQLADRYTPQPAGQTMLYRAESIAYYVALNATGVPALYRARADGTGSYPAGNREELVEGIESLQFLYGQDETPVLSSATPPVGDITEQQTATGVIAGAANGAAIANEWRRVGVVQVGLLARSANRAAVGEDAAEAQRHNVLGVRYDGTDSNDGFYRAGYEVTVALRNRLFGN
jgi:type IV pilus assembly protein PilW